MLRQFGLSCTRSKPFNRLVNPTFHRGPLLHQKWNTSSRSFPDYLDYLDYFGALCLATVICVIYFDSYQSFNNKKNRREKKILHKFFYKHYVPPKIARYNIDRSIEHEIENDMRRRVRAPQVVNIVGLLTLFCFLQ